eukprot:TRINITY_DN34766_c0_g2_i1.p1 TRINITY_DN34766_c0_g2~~TRINITY_DN34766_c0_g2_i1.p1  ORF type:complete len:206 (+),score=35.38 TRINITY_DN34766_c0_g2_i1:58-675(+)
MVATVIPQRRRSRGACCAIAVAISLAGVGHACFSGFRSLRALLPACTALALGAAPAAAGDVLTSADLDRIYFWQPLFASSLLAGTLGVVFQKTRKAGDLREEWAVKDDALRACKAQVLAGKPLPSETEEAMRSELERLQDEEEAERRFLGFVLPRPRTPIGLRMNAARDNDSFDAPRVIEDERSETIVVVVGVALLFLILLYAVW